MSALSFDNPWTTWVTSDTHAFHSNICKGCSKWEDGGYRDYGNAEAMTQDMANIINKYVYQDHNLIHLGDWSFGGFENIEKFRNMLNVKNIYLITGNHDRPIDENKQDCRKLFTKVYGWPGVSCLVDIRVGNNKYICGHYKMAIWNKSHRGRRNLWGHSHGSMPDDMTMLSFDAGWDVFKRPINFMEVEKILSKKEYKPVDHHSARTN